MAKKQTRNKFRNILADYYLTNREISKQNDAKYSKGNKQPWTGREKTMLLITIIALILIIIKYKVLP
ncbi:MAG: hypothetical protein ACOX4P_08565 [Anaerovoracaceae bacterium]|jgi:hypothetical protein